MAVSFSSVNAASIDTFGVACTVNGRSTTGIFRRHNDAADVGNAALRRPAPTLDLLTTEADAACVEPGHRVEIGAICYTVHSPPEPDDGGMTRLHLRKTT